MEISVFLRINSTDYFVKYITLKIRQNISDYLSYACEYVIWFFLWSRSTTSWLAVFYYLSGWVILF